MLCREAEKFNWFAAAGMSPKPTKSVDFLKGYLPPKYWGRFFFHRFEQQLKLGEQFSQPIDCSLENTTEWLCEVQARVENDRLMHIAKTEAQNEEFITRISALPKTA